MKAKAAVQPRIEWTGALNEPIVIPLGLPSLGTAVPDSTISPALMPRTEKLEMLREHYGISGSWAGEAKWMALAMALAIDFVPGFRTVYDDPLAAALGLPAKEKKGRQGKGAHPELWGARLLRMVEFAREQYGFDSDKAVCESLVPFFWKDLYDPKKAEIVQVPKRKKAVSLLLRRLIEAKKNAYGPAKRTPKRS